MLLQSRVTLFPHGPPDQETLPQLLELLIHCGADHSRILTHFQNLDSFLTFAKRINEAIIDPPPIIVLTETLLFFPNIISCRTAIQREMASLADALWVIYADPANDPFFQQNALKRGVFDVMDLHGSPIWYDRETSYDYLIFTPRTKDIPQAKLQADKLSRVPTGNIRRTMGNKVSSSFPPPSRLALRKTTRS